LQFARRMITERQGRELRGFRDFSNPDNVDTSV